MHTPGPWKYDSDDSIIVANGPLLIADLDPEGVIMEYAPLTEIDDNARLIAAAPDLLAACERMLPWMVQMIADGAHLNSVAPGDAVGAMEQAHAAIAKARQS